MLTGILCSSGLVVVMLNSMVEPCRTVRGMPMNTEEKFQFGGRMIKSAPPFSPATSGAFLLSFIPPRGWVGAAASLPAERPQKTKPAEWRWFVLVFFLLFPDELADRCGCKVLVAFDGESKNAANALKLRQTEISPFTFHTDNVSEEHEVVTVW